MPAGALRGRVRDQSVDGHHAPRSTPGWRSSSGSCCATTLIELGHRVHVLDAQPGLPDMVFAANGAFSVDGTVYGARFKYPQRLAEAAAHREFYRGRAAGGTSSRRRPTRARATSPTYPGLGLILAGYGYRTEPAAHAEAQEALGRPVVSLRLVDPRFYHLDTALAVARRPSTSPTTRARSRSRPGRCCASCSRTRVLADRAGRAGVRAQPGQRRAQRAAAGRGDRVRRPAGPRPGTGPVLVELTELKKGGGSVKCCVAELRA